MRAVGTRAQGPGEAGLHSRGGGGRGLTPTGEGGRGLPWSRRQRSEVEERVVGVDGRQVADPVAVGGARPGSVRAGGGRGSGGAPEQHDLGVTVGTLTHAKTSPHTHTLTHITSKPACAPSPLLVPHTHAPLPASRGAQDSQERHQVVEGVLLAHAVVGAVAKHEEVGRVGNVLPAGRAGGKVQGVRWGEWRGLEVEICEGGCSSHS